MDRKHDVFKDLKILKIYITILLQGIKNVNIKNFKRFLSF